MQIGRADYLWVNPKNGAIVAYLNTGHGIAQSWTLVNHGKHIAAGPGDTGDRVLFADLNGDGTDDHNGAGAFRKDVRFADISFACFACCAAWDP